MFGKLGEDVEEIRQGDGWIREDEGQGDDRDG